MVDDTKAEAASPMKVKEKDLGLDEPDEKPKIGFRHHYRDSNFISRGFYSYIYPLIDSMKQNDDKMSEEMIEDMNVNDDDTDKMLKKFETCLQKREDDYYRRKKAGEDVEEYYSVFKGAVFDTFLSDFLPISTYYFLSESLGVAYTSFLSEIINFIKKEDGKTSEGLTLVGIFALMMFFNALLKNKYIFEGYQSAIRARKVFISALYTKITKLSMKSQT